MSQRQKKTPDWMIERLALGELDAETAETVRAQLRAEGRSPEEALAALAASNQQLLAAQPAAAVAAELRRRSRAHGARRWFLGAPLVLAGVAAVALLFTRPATQPNPATGSGSVEPETIGIKGPLRLNVYRHGAENDQRLDDGARAARGDLLQLAYRGSGWGVLLSLDGRGTVTVHWPEREARAAALSEKGEMRLPSAYELDDAPGFERFFLVRAETPFDVAPVVSAARALAARGDARSAALPLPATFTQVSLRLDKPRKEMP